VFLSVHFSDDDDDDDDDAVRELLRLHSFLRRREQVARSVG